MSCQTHFLLNDREVCAGESAGMAVLDYLRNAMRLTGTKEGCREGDCGACVVLVGELSGERVCYRPVPSCLMPVGELQGRHLVTIEGLNMEDLSPVQQEIFEEGGSQCGFCTPGIVVSLTGYLLEKGGNATYPDIKDLLGGHLCRCTGYTSLKRAAGKLVQLMKDWAEDERLNSKDRVEAFIERKVIPAYFRDIPSRLRSLPSAPLPTESAAFVVAGGTDLYVQKGEALADVSLDFLNLQPEMKGISRKDRSVCIGALTTFEEFGSHPEIVRIIPHIEEYMRMVASPQIRSRATLGGNIVNASPIGDMTILLLALEARLVLKDKDKVREVLLRKFFKGYKNLDKAPSELVAEIIVPVPTEDTKIHFEKVSKRKYLDIASVNSAVRVRCDANGLIQDIGLTMGGVAPIPLFLQETCSYLKDRYITSETILGAFPLAQDEISPISDVRGSVEYKRLLVRQLIIAHFTALFPQYVKARDLL